ncbi:galactose-3-O-sulfotransferase 4-like [Gouania willdenowi]|uniref:Galactose-3-O-sulfotransferase 4-like n=1 Tax=Gouania willdenowi TaxID=441366 RepID=A0A8C5G302_GOUWI|nr:galactose-3-O-sulfotransferase 4-like [Gouania willdenowi]XP_028321350.1 galactose-3-O-sulfotransferase 4-like [Gouania willdenowi]
MPASFQSSLIRIGSQNSSETSVTDTDQDAEPKEVLYVGPMRTLEEIFNLSEERKKKKRDTYVCKPKSHIVFLKTHKTGSSTIQNLLYRYGDSKKLTFALPRNNGHRFSYPMHFQAQFVEGVKSGSVKEFNILCNHMRFKKSEVAKVMPANTFYFSILRHPVPMLESMFNYFKKLASKYKSKTINDYLDDCWKTYNPKRAKGDYTHNNLAFDFGGSNTATAKSPDLEERIDAAIKEIEGTFNLILINEYFDESLILLKEALCWSMEDMVTFKINSRSDKSRKDVPEETAENIKRWNALDWGLYQHFNATFWQRVDSVFGREEMERQVVQLRDLRSKMANTCLENGGAVQPSEIKDESLKPFQGSAAVLGYNLNPNIAGDMKRTCLQLITPELHYTSQLYERQFL